MSLSSFWTKASEQPDAEDGGRAACLCEAILPASDLGRYMDQPAAARYLMCIQSHFHECFRLMSLRQTQ
jgi:hypothetical protein